MVTEFKIKEKTVFVDSNLFEFLKIYKWHLAKGGAGKTKKIYATTSMLIGGKRYTVALHRLIMGMTAKSVDHINGNTLDNRRENLRLCSHRENMNNQVRTNPNGYRGVTKRGNRFEAQICFKGKKTVKGGFLTAEEAAKCYDEMSLKYHGEFGLRNFVEKTEVKL